jgi:Spy/CpxP family protein refolding chaperone
MSADRTSGAALLIAWSARSNTSSTTEVSGMWNRRMGICVIFGAGLALAPIQTAGAQQSPYAGLEHRQIKALSDEQREAYRTGSGMGLALAAELNGLPGPKHVLELADSLHLSEDQRARTAALFASMRGKAIELGEAIIESEERLDRWFRENGVDTASLAALTTEIGTLQGTLRYTHLSAHLTMRSIMTDEQVASYLDLRGYAADRPVSHQHQHLQ